MQCRVEEIAGSLEGARTEYDIFKCLRRAATAFDLDHFIVCSTPSQLKDVFGNRYLISTWDKELLERTRCEGLFDDEPFISLRHLSVPAAGTYAGLARRRVGNQAGKTAEILKEYDHRSYAIMPVWTPDGISGTVNFTGKRKPLSLGEFLPLQYLASLAFLRLRSLDKKQKPSSWLTERQRAVLQLTAEGSNAEQVASQLGITSYTVNFHLSNLMNMAHARNKTHLVALALMNGWITLTPH